MLTLGGTGRGTRGALPVGGLLVLAAGSAFVEGASGRAALRPGELVGAISSATVGRSGEDARSGFAIFDAGNAADVTAGPDGASLRCLDREKVTEYASGLGDASRVIRLALRAAARAEVRALPSDAFDAGPAIVIVDAGVRGGDALATLAERNGAAAATVDFAGDSPPPQTPRPRCSSPRNRATVSILEGSTASASRPPSRS